MRKFIITGMAVAMLAVPAAASASQPVNPGGFGQERAGNIQTYFTDDGYGNWGQFEDGAAARAGDNGAHNNNWKQTHGYLPAESQAGK
jgi:hypothetical protein